MLIKSLIILSMLFDMVGLHANATRVDEAIVRANSGRNIRLAEAYDITALPNIVARPYVQTQTEKPYINARHYLLADAESGVILLKSASNDRVPIASTTKIMTAVIALENFQLSDIATISTTASNQVGADAFLRPGEKITIENLLNCLLLKSGNDSAYAIAEHMNGEGETGTAKFVAKMNAKAKELGMNDTEYHDPAGLDVTGYSTARDLFLISRYAIKKPAFTEITSKEKEVVTNTEGNIWHELQSSNRMITDYHYMGTIGMKTGFMPEAGHCLVVAVQREGHTLISVVLSTFADTPTASAIESRHLQDWGWQNIIWK